MLRQQTSSSSKNAGPPLRAYRTLTHSVISQSDLQCFSHEDDCLLPNPFSQNSLSELFPAISARPNSFSAIPAWLNSFPAISARPNSFSAIPAWLNSFPAISARPNCFTAAPARLSCFSADNGYLRSYCFRANHICILVKICSLYYNLRSL